MTRPIHQLSGDSPGLSTDTSLENQNKRGHIDDNEDMNKTLNEIYMDIRNSKSSIPTDGKTAATKVDSKLPGLHSKGNRVSYASFFKRNRMANDNYKLEFMDTGTDQLEFGLDDIDSIEQTYGICLLGYIISGNPPTAALFDLVKRWGSDIRFQTHESGWIIFTFPSTEVRDRILNGGPYLVFGFHLFLKEMPRCFRFREEDMNTIPSWAQIHGLPPDCWNFNILSKLASRVGNPIHMDMLTHDRKRVKYARVLVEVDTTKQKMTDISVVLPIGKVEVKFLYEQDIKFCVNCKKSGHVVKDCTATINFDGTAEEVIPNNPNTRARSRSVTWNRRSSRGRSRFGQRNSHAPARGKSSTIPIVEQSAEIPVLESSSNKMNLPDTVPLDTRTEQLPETQPRDKGKRTMDNIESNAAGPSNEHAGDSEGYQIVVNKKNNKKKKKGKSVDMKHQGENREMAEFFADMEDGRSCDTELVNLTNKNDNNRYFGNMEKGRQPGIASKSQCMKVVHNFLLNDKGRIFVLWNPNKVNVDVGMCEQAIHVNIDCVATNIRFCVSFVYGLNKIVQRRPLWDNLRNFGDSCSLPWLVLGDFNTILSPDEKKGGLAVRDYDIKDFVECVSSLDLLDLNYIGCLFTWYSPKVCSKLDLVLVNHRWLSSNLQGLAEFVAPGCISDHTISIVSFLQFRQQQHKPFKFFNMWALSDRFLDIVRNNWNLSGYGTAQYRLKELFKNMKKPLTALNKYHFSHISARASAEKKKLQCIQEEMLSSGSIPIEYKDCKRKY
ncbi:uncharacterized protein LOC142505973 [Primulina tabacum]|uniref:uncharacterized protein LOC142505973 n=1 Tax=Primulina tabacum TaxID=48773 RepID=UPI003F5AD66D